jgi:hypothetical protein
MAENYLTWFKNLECELAGRDDCYQLLSSNVDEPLELLHGHINKYYNDILKARLAEPNSWGLPSLIDSLSFRYGISPKKILPAAGTTNALYLVMLALLGRGDRVIIELPVYEPLVTTARHIGTQISFLRRTAPDYRIDMDELAKMLTSQTKLVVLTNLHNPSGAFIRDGELGQISQLARKSGGDTLVMVDEIYHDFAIGIQPPSAGLDDNFVSVASLTKVYGLGLLRCGWIFARPDVIDKARVCSLIVNGIGSRLLEAISSIVIEHLDEYLAHSRQIVGQNRMILWDTIEPLLKEGILTPNIPENGCIYFPHVLGKADTSSFVQDLAEKYRVYVVPGKFFGEPEGIRIGFGGEPRQFEKSLGKFVEATSGLFGK